MQLQQRKVGSVTVIDVIGRMVLADIEADQRLRDAVTTAIEAGQRSLVVNLAQTTQADTSGLTAIVTAHAAAIRRGAQLKLADPSPRLRELFHVTRFDSFLQVYDTAEEAIASVTAT
jgi:anti-anti-sigma factor